MNYEITGNIEYIGEAEKYTDKFTKREFVLETSREHEGTKYFEYVKLELVNDRCDLINGLEMGDEVKVYFSIKGRKVNDGPVVRYYTNNRAWKIEKL